MSEAPNSFLFFHQGDSLITLKQGDRHRAIFRHSELSLAEQRKDDTHATGLLATDNKGSAFYVQGKDKRHAHSYTAYGYDPTFPARESLLGFNGERISSVTKHYLLGNGS